MDNKEIDKQKTIDVDNTKLLFDMDKFNKDKKAETFNAFLQTLVNSRLLVPSRLEDKNGKKVPMPLAFQNKEGQLFQPVYTDKEHLEKGIKAEGVSNAEFLNVANMVVSQSKLSETGTLNMKAITGIVINPQTDSVVLNTGLLEEILKNAKKKVQMTESQYVVFERNKFEQVYLVTRFFEEGKGFLDKISDKKEEFIDALFEESYENKRMYPYLPEEFEVLTITTSENIDVVRINLPTNDMTPGMCESIFLVWDSKMKKGYYYAMAMDLKNGGERNRVMIEVTGLRQAKIIGPAPAEGTELNWVLEKISK